VESFAVRVEAAPDTSIVHLAGELDMAGAQQVTQALDGIEGHITFDCSDLEFIDSSGLAIFARHARNGGASVVNATPRIRRVLEITGLDGLQI
jgi:anti-anti-sigma factor